MTLLVPINTALILTLFVQQHVILVPTILTAVPHAWDQAFCIVHLGLPEFLFIIEQKDILNTVAVSASQGVAAIHVTQPPTRLTTQQSRHVRVVGEKRWIEFCRGCRVTTLLA